MKPEYLLFFLLSCTTSKALTEHSYSSSVKFGELGPFHAEHNFTSVEYIEEDILFPGNYVLADQHALIYLTSDGTVTTLVGKINEAGYREGEDADALFNFIGGFTQYNKTDIAVVDVRNHCVRNVRRGDWSTSPFIGQCIRRNCMGVDETSDPLQIQLCYPVMIPFDPIAQIFYLNSFGSSVIYRYNFLTNLMSSVVYNPQHLGVPSALLLSSDRSLLYVAHEYGVSTVDVIDGNVTLLTGHSEVRTSGNHVVDAQQSATLGDALYNSPAAGLVWLIPDQVLLFGDVTSLRMIDLSQGHVEAICKGDTETRSIVWGPIGTCGLHDLNFITRIKDTIYIVDKVSDQESIIGTLPILAGGRKKSLIRKLIDFQFQSLDKKLARHINHFDRQQ